MIPTSHRWALLAILIALVVFGSLMYPRLPDPCPIHWNLRGEVDGYGPRWMTAFLLPAILAAVMALLVALPMLGPFRKNLEAFRVVYGRICVLLAAMFTAITVLITLAAAGHDVRLGPSLFTVLGAMFAVLGLWLSKVRRNLYVGIRTPWTIANEEVWRRTHLWGGRLFSLVGLATVATALLLPEAVALSVLLGGIGAAVLWALLYSLFCYRKLGQVDDLCPPAHQPPLDHAGRRA